MAFIVKLYPEDIYSGGTLPNTAVGKKIFDIIRNYKRYYSKLSVVFRTLMLDETDKLFREYKTKGKISFCLVHVEMVICFLKQSIQ